MVLLFACGVALIALALVVSARMTAKTPFGDRLGAAAAAGTGALAAIAGTFQPDLLMPAMGCLVLCAGWFALHPPDELAPQSQDEGTRQQDA